MVEVAAGVARLVNDNGAGSTAAGADGRVANGQCAVTAGRVERSKQAVAVQLRLQGKPGFRGAKQVYTIAMDGNGQGAGLAAAGVAILVWLLYRASGRVTRLLGQSGARVLSRLVAFLLLCIGVQITASGFENLVSVFLATHPGAF